MPIQLATPRQEKKPSISQQVVFFGPDLLRGVMLVTINDYDEDGKVNASRTHEKAIVDEQGNLLSPASDTMAQNEVGKTLYEVLKARIYALARKEGWVESGDLT